MTPDSLLRSDADELLNQAVSQLRQRLETGQDCRAETVLGAFPSLASDPERAVELIVLEFRLRRQLGQSPQPGEWYQRFPQWREQLRTRLEEVTPDSLDRIERETAALATSPYGDSDRQTFPELDVDVPDLGRHAILEEIDRGGMGVVYRARDLVLDRVVAMKVIRSGIFASSEEVKRFYQEARAAAQLRHPGIVPIYGMGMHERQHCFTMALFPRGSLVRHLADYLRDMRAAVGLLVKVARAVQAAHEYGIVHRDLKPGNILMDERGEPVVSDFGLAKRLEVSTTLTLPAHAVGTPAYMAPEQVRCEAATASSDIWSLGVILYELLTGRVPFPGRDADEVKHKVLHDDPLSPRRLCPDLPRELETILRTCLEKEPKGRYPSAAALADDLERWQRGEAIRARPEPRWQQLRRQFRRRVGKKGVILLLIGLLLAATGGVGVWTLFVYRSPEATKQRSQELVLASLQRALAEGKSVTLVGPVGPPLYYRWRTEKGRAPLPEQDKWPLKLSSGPGPLILELLRDPQRTSYRFSAEVRLQLNKEGRSEIGLYFAGEERATPAGPEQCFKLFRLVSLNAQMTSEHLFFGYIEQDTNGRRRKQEVVPSSTAPPEHIFRVPPPPAGEANKEPWRRIEVQVTPVDVRGFCDGLPMGHYVIAQEQARLSEYWQIGHQGDSPLPTFPLRGGLGLYVYNGPAFFRNVVVEPVQEP